MKVNSYCIRHKLAYMQLFITVSGSTVNGTAVTEPLNMPTTTSSTPASVSIMLNTGESDVTL